MTDQTPTAPAGLGTQGSNLWSSIAGKWVLRPDEELILSEACREADLIEAMRVALGAADLVIAGSTGQDRVHPLVSEIRQHRAVMKSLLQALKLPDEGGAGSTNQQREAGQASWASRSRGA